MPWEPGWVLLQGKGSPKQFQLSPNLMASNVLGMVTSHPAALGFTGAVHTG